MTQREISKRIVQNEMTIQKAIWDGHKPCESDKFQPLRVETEILRCLYFGENSEFCRRRYRK